MKILKKALICICSLVCAMACGLGITSVSNKVEASADTASVSTRTLKIDNSSRQEYYFHNATPITEGQDFTIEFTVEEITTTIDSGIFAATGTTDAAWTYNTVIGNSNYYTLFQNNAASLNLEKNHYRYYFKYMTSGNYAGQYQINRYVNGTHNYTNEYNDYQPYMGLYFINFNFEMTLTGVKCYEGSGSSTKDVGLYTDSEGTDFYMEDGASVRLSDPTGLGFTSRISYGTYNELIAEYGEENVSTGTLIAMASDVDALDSFTHAGLNTAGVKHLDVKNKGFKNVSTAETDGYYSWRGSVVNLYEHNHDKDFASVGYLCVNGEYTYTVYNAEDHARNVRYVAEAAYNDTEASKTGDYVNEVADAVHPAVGEYSPYTTDQLQILSKYLVTFEDSSLWWSITKTSTNPLMSIVQTGDMSWDVGLTLSSTSDAYSTFTLKASTIKMLKKQGCVSVSVTFASKTNQANAFYLYNTDMTSIGAANKKYAYAFDLTDEAAENGVAFVVKAIDLSSNSAWEATEALDGFTMTMSLGKTFNEEIKNTWFRYNGLYDGITYNETEESWIFTVDSGKVLHLDAAAVSKYYAEGALALQFAVSSKTNQETGLNFSGYATANKSTSFTVDITDTLCTNGLDISTYYSTLGWTEGMDASDGYVIKITPVTILEREDKWFVYDDTTEGITYADSVWTVAGESGKLLTLDKEMVNYYLDQGMGSLTYTIGWKDGKQAAMSVKIPNSAEVLLSHNGDYTASSDTVAANASFKVTVQLTETMAREGMSMYVYFYDRGWSGDTAGVDGFTVSITEGANNMLEKKWVVGNGLNVAFDGTTYTLTNASGGALPQGYNHLGISEALIEKMLAQGHTTLSFNFKLSAASPYDFVVPDLDAVSTALTVTLNITDLSANGNASTHYNPEGYFPLRLYINNTASAEKMYITFTEVPEEAYAIVYSADATSTEINAANMLATHLEEATGVAYDVVSDRHVAWTETSKYISVGQTTLLSEVGFSALAENNVSGDGYIRRTVGNTLFIDGITERGSLYGVLDYLEDAYGYIFISDGVYSYTANPNLVVSDLDKDFTPTFETRTYLNYGMYASNTNATTALYNKANSYYLNASKMSGYGGVENVGYIGECDHNMYDTLVEGVALYNAAYSTSYVATDFAQAFTIGSTTYYNPCLSGGKSKNGLTALDFMTLAMKNCILGQYASGVRYYSLTQEDTNGSDYCTCSTCTSQASTYGRSGIMVNFLNDMIAKLDADADIKAAGATDYRLITFAYQYTKAAPTGGVTCNDKLVVRLAYAADDAQDGIAQSSDKYIEQWSAVASELMYWGYDVDFSSYLPYFASITGAMADNVKYLKDNNVSFVMMQGAHNADNIWHSQLRAYVYSKLTYDFDETAYANGADAYVQSLVTEYLNVYYGEYADEVQSVIDYYQNVYASYTVNDNGSSSPAALLTTSNHSEAFKKVSSSYEACTDAVLKQRLAAVLASCYAGQYEATTYGYQKEAMHTTLKEYCDVAGITMWSESLTVAEVCA